MYPGVESLTSHWLRAVDENALSRAGEGFPPQVEMVDLTPLTSGQLRRQKIRR